MRKSRMLAVAAAVTLGGIVGAFDTPRASAEEQVDCSKVIKAKDEAGVSVSTKDLAQRLGLPVDKVQACLRDLRQGPQPTAAAHH